MDLHFKFVSTPIGRLKLVASHIGLTALLWENDDPKRVRLGPMEEAIDHPILVKAEAELLSYFTRSLRSFSLPLDFVGTEFQKQVWRALLTIPYGETRSYQEIAHQIQHPNAARAVGAANGKNPISIVAPCHRVIGKN